MLLKNFILIPSFCKQCGVDVRDFHVDNNTWKQVEGKIKNGNTLCYNCFCDECEENGITPYWKLVKMD